MYGGEIKMQEMLERLKIVLKDCREDMHEPDEQGITVAVTGYHLDNAMGDDPKRNCGEMTVGIMKNHDGHFEWFNLATLIALARKADLKCNK